MVRNGSGPLLLTNARSGRRARPLRIHGSDGWYHVMSRTTGVETVFRRDQDRRRFLGLVSELPERFGTEVYALVLMDNHYHLATRHLGWRWVERMRTKCQKYGTDPIELYVVT